MQRETIRQLGATEQHLLDEWFDTAIEDPTVRPYLTTGVHSPRLLIPDDDSDGIVLMTKRENAVLKLYFDEESGTTRIGIWVLDPGADDFTTRGRIAYSLMRVGITVCKRYPNIRYMATRVMDTNLHGINFSSRLFDQWGIEKHAVFDTSSNVDNRTGGWSHWVHFRTRMDIVEARMTEWEGFLDGKD